MRKRQAGTGNDLESQINKNKETVTSIKRQNDNWSIKIRSIKETTLRKCTGRNTEAEKESWAEGRDRDKGTGGEVGHNRQPQAE